MLTAILKNLILLNVTVFFLECLSLNMKALQSFEMSGQQAVITQKTRLFGKTALKISNFAKWHCLSHKEMNYFSASRWFIIKHKYPDHILKRVHLFITFDPKVTKFHINSTITTRIKSNQVFYLDHFCMNLKHNAYDPASSTSRSVCSAQSLKPY